jgi:hypothetical protein
VDAAPRRRVRAARHDHHRDAGLRGPRHHRADDLAQAALAVVGALARDDEAGACEPLVEARPLQHPGRALDEPGAQKRHRPRAQPPRRAAPGQPPDVDAEVRADTLGEPAEALLERLHRRRTGALLRPEDARRAFGTQQRVAHIGESQSLARAGTLDRREYGAQRAQARAAARDRAPVAVQESPPQGLRHAGAAVHGGRSAQPQDQPSAAGGADELADSEARRDGRIASRLPDEREPAHARALDDGAAVEAEVLGAHVLPERAGDHRTAPRAPGRVAPERGQQPVAAVRQGDLFDGAEPHRAEALRHGARGDIGRQRALECGGADEDGLAARTPRGVGRRRALARGRQRAGGGARLTGRGCGSGRPVSTAKSPSRWAATR